MQILKNNSGEEMKILFLGTGAADWPKENNSIKNDYRRNSSVLIDNRLLIDPGPGVLNALEEFGIDKNEIKYIINTHKHGDHYDVETLKQLVMNGSQFINLEDNDTVQIESFTIQALKANHGTCENTVHFIISDGDKRFFYGLDGAWLLYDEFQAIKQKKVDFAVLDATIGNKDGDYRIFEHNNLFMVREMKKSLKKYIDRFCISHMAYTLHDDHKTLSDEMSTYGIEVAYDGMIVEI